MPNGYQESNAGGISFSTPLFSFGNTTPAVNSGFNFDLPMATIQTFSNQALSFTQNNAALNKGFLQGVIDQSGKNVTATADAAFNLQSQALGSLTSFSNNIMQTIDSAVNRTRGGCFITTAICKDKGLPDDCDDLKLLRNFRDNVLIKTHEGRVAVKTYYLVAPEIVECIDHRNNASEIYKVLNDAYLQPAIRLIKFGDNNAAFEMYKAMVNYAANFLIKEPQNG